MSGSKEPQLTTYKGNEAGCVQALVPGADSAKSERIEIFLRFTFCTRLELNCLLLITAVKVVIIWVTDELSERYSFVLSLTEGNSVLLMI